VIGDNRGIELSRPKHLQGQRGGAIRTRDLRRDRSLEKDRKIGRIWLADAESEGSVVTTDPTEK